MFNKGDHVVHRHSLRRGEVTAVTTTTVTANWFIKEITEGGSYQENAGIAISGTAATEHCIRAESEEDAKSLIKRLQYPALMMTKMPPQPSELPL